MFYFFLFFVFVFSSAQSPQAARIKIHKFNRRNSGSLAFTFYVDIRGPTATAVKCSRAQFSVVVVLFLSFSFILLLIAYCFSSAFMLLYIYVYFECLIFIDYYFDVAVRVQSNRYFIDNKVQRIHTYLQWILLFYITA